MTILSLNRVQRQVDSHWRPRIMHVIGSLDVGGAERCLCALLTQADRRLAEMGVVTLIPGGILADDLRWQGIRVESLAMRPGRPDPRAVFKLARLLRRDRPDVVVTWMYHANLIGGLAARFAGGIPVVWNIRHTVLDRQRSKGLTRWTARAGGWLSRRLPAATVYVAHSAQTYHSTLGYDLARAEVIPNGFDTREFRPDPEARASMRHELGCPASSELVGLIGRFHPDKDHRTFLAAAARIRAARPQTQFVLCGDGVSVENRQLAAWITRYGLEAAVHCLGRRDDIARVATALDVAVCSSLSEAFPRAVGEAMSCAVPVVVTHVGDAAHLVGDTGRVVTPGDSAQLAAGVLELLVAGPLARCSLGMAARQRIVECFGLERVLARHVSLWRTVAGAAESSKIHREEIHLRAA